MRSKHNIREYVKVALTQISLIKLKITRVGALEDSIQYVSRAEVAIHCVVSYNNVIILIHWKALLI